MTSQNATGLRERKKRATTNSIERAAVYLALELGHDNVTVAGICERADVSRSTFFNHMPTRESAMFGRPIALADAASVEAVLAGSIDVPITTALLRIIFLSVGDTLVNPEVAAARLRLAKTQPETELPISAPITALLYELTHFLTDWLERHPERRALPEISAEREAAGLVLLTGAGFRAIIAEMSGSAGEGRKGREGGEGSGGSDGRNDGSSASEADEEAQDVEVSEAAFEAAIDEIRALATVRRSVNSKGATA